MEKVSMEIQTFNGIEDSYQNLVLYSDISLRRGDSEFTRFMAAIYEADTETFPDDKVPILLFSGTRRQEWTKALACIDILLNRHYSKRIGPQLASWVFEMQAGKNDGYQLLIEIRNQGRDTSVVLPKFRLHDETPYGRQTYPSTVVYRAIRETHE